MTVGRKFTHAWHELFGWLIASGLALITTSLIAAGPRAELLFRDSDALLPVLVSRSLATGQPQDWALSSVLFLPEATVFLPLTLLQLPPLVTLWLAGVVWFVLLYGAIRVVAGSRARAVSPVAGSVFAFAAFCLLALTETSSSAESGDAASYVASSTYYVATVVACVLTVGVLRRWNDGASVLWCTVALVLISGLSTLSNPLYAVWGIFPILIVGAIVMTWRMAWPAVALIGAGTVGLVSRGFLGDHIGHSGFAYIQPLNAPATGAHFVDALMARLAEPAGVIGVALTLGLIVLGWVVGLRASETDTRLVALIAGMGGLLVLLAMVMLGSETSRYLQPLTFYAVLVLTTVRLRRGSVVVGALAAGASVLCGVLMVPTALTALTRADADLQCLVSYANTSDRVGGGQYWAVRLPKATVDDPRSLVQVTHDLHAYDWLVNRDDYRDVRIGYLVTSSADHIDPGFAPVDPTALEGSTSLSCGRYTITELREDVPLSQ